MSDVLNTELAKLTRVWAAGVYEECVCVMGNETWATPTSIALTEVGTGAS